MTEEERLNRAPGCGSIIMLGLIGIVILSLFGAIFPVDILPYPSSVLFVIAGLAAVASVVAFFIQRGKKIDAQKEEDDRADRLMRKGFETLGEKDDEAARLAEKYKDEDAD